MEPTTVVTIVAAIALVAILTIKEEIVSAPPFGEPPSEVVVLQLHTLSICLTETSMYLVPPFPFHTLLNPLHLS